MEKLYVIKIGGNVIDDEQKLSSFLKDFAKIKALNIGSWWWKVGYQYGCTIRY